MIVDLYSGPRGWSEGLRLLGLDDIGIEIDAAACATAAAAGHRTIRADVATYPAERFVDAEGVIISPPCQSFSAAGAGDGRDELAALVCAVRSGEWHSVDPDRSEGWGHVLEVGRWVETIRPRWVACEQVPPVLPVWQAYAARWRALGWSTWAGILNAADVGVPQTRRRAFLLASADGPVGPPEPTHCPGGADTLLGSMRPWVSMAEALGWDGEDTPARTLCGDRAPRWLYPDRDGTHGRVLNRRTNSKGPGGVMVPTVQVSCDRPAPTLTVSAGAKSMWVWERPATTVCGDPRLSFPGHHDEDHRGLSADEGSVKLTLEQALTLQSFRPDYPVQGTKTKKFEQIGNAVPPLLAAQVVAAVTGRVLEERAA